MPISPRTKQDPGERQPVSTTAGQPALTTPGGATVPAGEPARRDITGGIAELQRLVLATHGIGEFLRGLAGLASGLLPGGLSCGVALESDGKPMTASCSDDVASQVDEVQFLLGEGPCPDALRQQQAVCVADTATATAWPGFAPLAASYGVRSCLCLPLVSDRSTIGALSLYATRPHVFGAAEIRVAAEFAGHAASALAVASRLAAYTALTDQLRASLASRAIIDQALGVIMARERCSQAEAFTILRNASQRRNVKLREVARWIVTEVSGEVPQPPPFREG